MKNGSVSVTIRLPADVHARLKEIRKDTGAPIQHQVLKAVRAYLGLGTEKKRGA